MLRLTFTRYISTPCTYEHSFQDLVDADVMILDSGAEIYVWVGKNSDEEEKQESLKMAKVREKCTYPGV